MPIERWRHQPVQIRSNGDAHGNLVGVSRYDNTGGGRYEKGDVYISRGQSQRMRRHGDERQSAPVGNIIVLESFSERICNSVGPLPLCVLHHDYLLPGSVSM